MKKSNMERRRVAAMGGAVAASSSLGPVLFPHDRMLRWVWLGVLLALLARAVFSLVKARRAEGCV